MLPLSTLKISDHVSLWHFYLSQSSGSLVAQKSCLIEGDLGQPWPAEDQSEAGEVANNHHLLVDTFDLAHDFWGDRWICM